MNNLGNIHMIPVLSPVDTTTTVTEAYTDVVDAGECTEIEFVLYNGVVTGDTVVVLAYKDANTTAGGGTAIPFRYKLSDTLGTDASGAWTYVAATGYTMPADADGKVLRVNIDPAHTGGGFPYVYLGLDPGAGMTNWVHGVVCVTIPRYNESTPASALD